jgi:hypothetical protein
VLTAALYIWGLDRNGYANVYYSAAVLAGRRLHGAERSRLRQRAL